MPTHRKIRIFLFMLAFGLASVQFFPFLYDKWTEVYVDLPKVESDSLIIVIPENPPFYKKFTKADLIENRDLSLYDSLPAFSNCLNRGFDDIEFRKCQNEIPKTRDFILQHWKTKKRAYIVYEWTGIDTGSDTYIFIEPDCNGEWHIILRGSGDFRFQTLWEKTGYSLKYRKATKDDYPLERGTYVLSALDSNEKEIESF